MTQNFTRVVQNWTKYSKYQMHKKILQIIVQARNCLYADTQVRNEIVKLTKFQHAPAYLMQMNFVNWKSFQ